MNDDCIINTIFRIPTPLAESLSNAVFVSKGELNIDISIK